MKFALAYYVIGLVLVAQAVLRSDNARYELRKNPMDALVTWAGVSLLWPLVLVGDARQWLRDRKYRP